MKGFMTYMILLTFASASVRADHCPEERQASGEAETTLAGISFERGHFPEVLRRYGPADSKEEHTDASYPEGSGEARYLWNFNSGRLEVFTMFYHRNNFLIESVIDVRIEGDAGRQEWQTGRGLRPGDSFDKAVKLYGSVFLEGTVSGAQPPGPRATVCFSNETRLGLEIDREGKITVIRLAPSIE